MKTIYYCECDSNNEVGMDLVYWLNEKFMATFNKRKDANEWLVKKHKYLKTLCFTDVKKIKKQGLDTTITFDLYKFKVDDDFDVEVDNPWDKNYEYNLIDSRYLCGRY